LGYGDTTYKAFTETTTYKNRGMVFVGSNSGMLHAFRLGVLKENSGKFDKAQFNNTSGALATDSDNLGKEEWTFIPKQVLPYLTYVKDPNYCHIYTVDKTSTVVDVSVNVPTGCTGDYWDCTKATDGSTWKSVLIGGMGTGGAAKWNGDSTYTAPTDSVKTPVKNPYGGTDSADKGIGYSSYFALDVTDPTSPKYLWEFPGPNSTAAYGQLGYTTTGPAVVRVAAKTGTNSDNTKNGRWFAVFASGPTGPIDPVKREFKGQSDQQLKIFVVDMADGLLVRTITQYYNSTGTLVNLPSYAFAGSLSGAMVDTDRATSGADGWYSDDAVYIGFVKKHTDNTWTKGGVLRLLTNESTNPADWKVSMLVDGIGPVTSSVTKLQDRRNKNLWIFFGSGRFFMKGDDVASQQAIYGVKEPCYSTNTRTARFSGLTNLATGAENKINKVCYDPVPSGLINQSGALSTAPQLTLAATDPGWYINLDPTAGASFAERMITDPVASPAGAVFFTTFKPSNDVCKFGGDSLIWAARYDTGGVPPARAMQGKALMQVSTGAFAELSLSTAFSNPGNDRLDGRRLTTPISGVPPTSQGLSLITNPPPVKKFLHVREK
jgi:type IV pilus assembly protein PilY1